MSNSRRVGACGCMIRRRIGRGKWPLWRTPRRAGWGTFERHVQILCRGRSAWWGRRILMGRGCRRIRRRRSSGFARLPRRGIWKARETLDMLIEYLLDGDEVRVDIIQNDTLTASII